MVGSYGRSADTTLAVPLLLLVLLFGYLCRTSAESLAARGAPHHPDLRRESRKDAGSRYLEQWGYHTGSIESAVEAHRTHSLTLWILFPLVCALLSMSAIAFFTNEPDKDSGKWIPILFLPRVMGGVFDSSESCLRVSVLQWTKSAEDLCSIPPDSIDSSFIVAVSKLSLMLPPPLAAMLLGLYRRHCRIDS